MTRNHKIQFEFLVWYTDLGLLFIYEFPFHGMMIIKKKAFPCDYHGTSGPWFNIKMTSYQYRKSHCGDKTVVRSSYLHNVISYTGKMTSLYWIRALNIMNNGCWPSVLGNLIIIDFIISGCKRIDWYLSGICAMIYRTKRRLCSCHSNILSIFSNNIKGILVIVLCLTNRE